MKEYHKIQSVFKRDEQTHKFILGVYSLPEFDYLADNPWVFTEKIDGTNVRVMWDGQGVSFGGRTDNAQMPPFLLSKLQEMFPVAAFADLPSLCLYGEGYGAKIQKGGGNYISDGCSFILFDVLVDKWWLRRDDVADIAAKLGVRLVPVVGWGTIGEAVNKILDGVTSTFGNFPAEGMVLRPACELAARNGARIITKLKHRDF